jgi:hypothetical protein
LQFKKHRREITRMAATAGNKHTEAVVRRAAGRVIVADVPLKGLVAALDPGIAPHVGRVDSNSGLRHVDFRKRQRSKAYMPNGL